MNEGLSQNSVYSIYQDRKGFLWIGTGDGLNRYDGKAFTTYKGKYDVVSSNVLNDRIVRGRMVEDKFDRLWFFTNESLTVFDKRANHFFKPLSNLNFPTTSEIIDIDSSGILWITESEKIIGIDTEKSIANIYILPERVSFGGAFLMGGKIFGTSPSGLATFDTRTQKFKTLVGLQNLHGIFLQKSKTILLQTNKALFTYNPSNEVLNVLPLKAFNFEQWRIRAEYPDNILYATSSGKGMCKIDLTTLKFEIYQHHPTVTSSLSNNYTGTLFLDKSHNLWIGTEGGGLSMLDLKQQKFKSFPGYNINTQLASNLMVKSVYKNGRTILAGTFNQGLFVLDAISGIYKKYQYPQLAQLTDPNSINIIYRDSLNRLWMNMGGIIGYIDNDFKFVNYAAVESDTIHLKKNLAVYSICELSKNNFLIGTNFTLYKMKVFANNSISIDTAFQKQGNVFGKHIQSIKKAKDGTLYIGTIGNGFLRVKIENDDIKFIDSGMVNTGIRDFYFADNHLVWMATENGLAVYDPKTQETRIYDQSDGMSNSYVYGILAENDRSLWFSTNKGINNAIIEYQNTKVKSVRFTNFTQTDGLQSNEFNSGAFYKSQDGQMMFGGVNGINWFKPSEIISNFYMPPLALTGLSINEKKYNERISVHDLKSIRLPHSENSLTFTFAALEYTNPAANTYSYTLEGFDKTWINNGNRNEARYPNLPPGQYVFKFKAANSDGLWAKTPLSFSVVITPPFWQTWWFQLLLAIVMLTAIILLIRYYITVRIKRKTRELEKLRAVNEERVRISKDMHDELGTGLTKIALLTEVRKQGQSNAPDEIYLNTISQTARELTQKMGEIIWTLDAGNDTLENLAAYLKEYVYESAESLPLEIDTDFPEKIPNYKITNVQRQHVFYVTKEAIHNAVKHAAATKIFFKIRLSDNQVIFEITDNGTGFNIPPQTDVNRKKNGLSNMPWRMSKIGGTFSITSQPKAGTTVTYSFSL